MGKITESMKTWGSNHPRTVRFGKALATVMAKGLAESTIGALNTPAPVDAGDIEVLTAEQIMVLEDMTSMQLRAIFTGRRVTFATDKDTLAALDNLTPMQICAILGRK